MDQREFNRSNQEGRFLPPGQLPEPSTSYDDHEWKDENFRFPMPPRGNRSQEIPALPQHRQTFTTPRGSARHIHSASYPIGRDQEDHGSTPYDMANPPLIPATDTSHQTPYFSHPNPSSTTPFLNGSEHTANSALNEAHSKSYQQMPIHDNFDPSLFSFDNDPSLSFNMPPPSDTSYLTPDPFAHSFSPSPYAQTPHQEIMSSHSPFLPVHSPFNPHSPLPRAQFQGHGLSPSLTSSVSSHHITSDFESSPFDQNEFLQEPSHLTPEPTLPIRHGRAGHHRRTSNIEHRRSRSGNPEQTSNFLSPHTPHSRQSSAGSGPRRPRAHSHVSSTSSAGLLEQRPLPSDPITPRFFEASNVSQQDSRAIPYQAEVEAESKVFRNPEDQMKELEVEVEKQKKERSEIVEEIKEVGDEINRLVQQRDLLIGSGLSGQKKIVGELRELRAKNKTLFKDLREFDTKSGAASARLVDLRQVVNRHAGHS